MSHRVISNLTEFSDDIILQICSNLKSSDLINVIETCDRLCIIGKDHSLWKTADFSSIRLTASQFRRQVLRCLHHNTSSLHIKGHKRDKLSKLKTDLITASILKILGNKCPKLTQLCLSEAVVNSRKLRLWHFQEIKSVEDLRIIDCEFINLPSATREGSYFKNMMTYMPNLSSLEISYSNWITDYDLMVLSKLDTLKRLVLKCNLRIGFTTAYLSISFRFGFKALEDLDLRGTSLTDMEIQSICQGGRLKCLKLGPIGKVKRLTNDIDEGFGLVIPDPHRKDEPKQQVVVINMSPNGPEWRQASDDDLDLMGLHWLKKGLNKMRNNVADKEEEHFFFGKEGKIIKNESTKEGESSSASVSGGECSSSASCSKKRKLTELDSESPQQPSADAKRFCDDEENSSTEEEDEEEETSSGIRMPNLPTKESSFPDALLSDLMSKGFRTHGQNLEHLEVNGCSITDAGIVELVKCLPLLTYLDVSKSHVTSEGLQRARILAPKCKIVHTSLGIDDDQRVF